MVIDQRLKGREVRAENAFSTLATHAAQDQLTRTSADARCTVSPYPKIMVNHEQNEHIL